jgi:hypothetical protein
MEDGEDRRGMVEFDPTRRVAGARRGERCGGVEEKDGLVIGDGIGIGRGAHLAAMAHRYRKFMWL